MTSVTTVMALYNILTMPDGSDLTPQSVNDWFNGNARKTSRGWVSQGYIYGDVIWTAANQLSGEIAKIRPGSPTIKFSRTGTGSEEEIRTELKAGRPIVLEVPGHWISAVGIDDNNKILINDPFYRDRKTLDAYAGKVKSSVLFEASDDLSAVVITVPADERVRVTNIKTGEQVGDLNTGSQQDAKDAAKLEIPGASYSARDGWRDPTCIASPPPPGSGTNQIVLPGSKDDYKIEVLDTSGGTASVAIHTYDKSGSPSVTTLDNAGSVVASVGYDPTQGQPQVQQLDETPQADSSSDRVAGKTPTPVKPSPTATTPATVTPEATPTQGPVTTILSLSVSPGAKVVNIGSNLGFGLGDTIRFSPGASNEEDNTIVGFGSFILAAPLKYAHSAGEPIVRIAGVPGGGAPPPPTSTDIPPPDGVKLDCSPIYSAAPRQATLICSATVTGTFTTTRWTVDGRVQSQFSGQTIIVTVFTQDATTALTVAACNVTVCVSAATTQAIRFPVSPNEPQSEATPTPPPPVPTPPPAPPATGLAASCSLTITTNPDATIKCQPLTNIKTFSSITWDIPALTPSSSRPSPDGSPLLRVIKPADLVPDKSGNADVLITATLCSASTSGPSNNCTVSAPATISIPYATTTLSVLPVTDATGTPPKLLNLGNTASFFAVIKGPVVPSGGTVQFVTIDTNGKPHPVGLEQKVQLYPGFAFAQLNVPTGSIPLDAEGHYDIQAVYSGSNNIFGGPSATVGLDVGPKVEDTCNSLDDNADGRVDENCVLPDPVSGQTDIGSGTVLRGITVNGTTNVAKVTPGQALDVAGGVSRKSSPAGTDLYCAGCTRQVYLGVGPNAAVSPPVPPLGPVCAVNQSLDQYDDTVPPLAFDSTALSAPTTPGLYYVRATGSVQSSCGQPDVGGPNTSVGQVTVKGATQTTLQPIAAPVKLGDHVTISATVLAVAPATGQPTGEVQFCDDSITPLASPGPNDPQKCVTGPGIELLKVPLTDGPPPSGSSVSSRVATLDLDTALLYSGVWSANPVKGHNISAHFLDVPGGSSANPYWGASDSGQQTLQVNPADVTTEVQPSTASVVLGQHIALTAVVRSGGFGPFSDGNGGSGGFVRFTDGTQAIGDACVSGQQVGIAVLDLNTANPAPAPVYLSVSPPTHTISAIYYPDPAMANPAGPGGCGIALNYGPTPQSQGGSVTSGVLTVTPALPTIALSLPSGTAVLGDQIVLTATLSSVADFGAFGGMVQFERDGKPIGGPATITNGVATVTFDTSQIYTDPPASPPPTIGSHQITAVYQPPAGTGVCPNPQPSVAGNYCAATAPSQLLTITQFTPTVTLDSTTTTLPLGQAISPLTARLRMAKGFGAIRGTVEFREGATLIGTGTVSDDATTPGDPNDGAASCHPVGKPTDPCDTGAFFSPTTPSIVTGPHVVTAYYLGTGNYAPADSTNTPLSLTITGATATVALTGFPLSAQLGSSTALQATVSPRNYGPLSGSIDFEADGVVIASGPVDPTSGAVSAAINWSNVAVVAGTRTGPHSVTAVYNDNGDNYAVNDSSADTLTVNGAVVTLILTANPTTLVGAQSVTFTASASSLFGPPTGTVTLTATNGGTPVTLSSATGTLISNGANDSKVDITASGLPPGTTRVTATLAANGDYAMASNSNGPVDVNVVSPTLTTVSAVDTCNVTGPANQVIAPCPVTFNVTVTCPSCGGSPDFTGLKVIIELNGTALPTQAVLGSNGQGSSQGNYSGSSPWLFDANTVLARFQGGGSFAPSDSAPLPVTERTNVTTTVAFGATSPVNMGSTALITATLAAQTGGATVSNGTVQFMDGTTAIGTPQAVSGGTATLAISAITNYGARSISAHYIEASGGLFATSLSANETASSITIVAPTSLAVSVPGNGTNGTAFTATATVSCVGTCTGAGSFSGSVTFFEGTTNLGTASVSGAGVATQSITFTSNGNHTITATYTGGGNYTASSDTSGGRITIGP